MSSRKAATQNLAPPEMATKKPEWIYEKAMSGAGMAVTGQDLQESNSR